MSGNKLKQQKIFIEISSARGEERRPFLKLKNSHSLKTNNVFRMGSSREINDVSSP